MYQILLCKNLILILFKCFELFRENALLIMHKYIFKLIGLNRCLIELQRKYFMLDLNLNVAIGIKPIHDI